MNGTEIAWNYAVMVGTDANGAPVFYKEGCSDSSVALPTGVAGAAGERREDYAMTGNELRSAVCKIAEGWLGRRESDGSHRLIIDYYDKFMRPGDYVMQYSDPWCATFTSAVGMKVVNDFCLACKPYELIPSSAACDPKIVQYQRINRWVEDDTFLPQLGDEVFYDWQDDGQGDNHGSTDHVGLVVGVFGDTDTGRIYGACNHIFSVLLEGFTAAKMICITQPSSYSRTIDTSISDATAQALGFEDAAAYLKMTNVQLSNYAMAIKEEAVRRTAIAYGVPVLDAFAEFPTVLNSANRAAYWQNDKLHLSSNGNAILASMIQKKIKEVFSE